MDSKKRSLRVILSLIAIDELDAIWRWNAHRYGEQHANQYILFLKESIDALNENYNRGKVAVSRTDLRYVMIRRKSRGHGHVAVYRIGTGKVDILHVFHTAQNWRETLDADS